MALCGSSLGGKGWGQDGNRRDEHVAESIREGRVVLYCTCTWLPTISRSRVAVGMANVSSVKAISGYSCLISKGPLHISIMYTHEVFVSKSVCACVCLRACVHSS